MTLASTRMPPPPHLLLRNQDHERRQQRGHGPPITRHESSGLGAELRTPSAGREPASAGTSHRVGDIPTRAAGRPRPLGISSRSRSVSPAPVSGAPLVQLPRTRRRTLQLQKVTASLAHSVRPVHSTSGSSVSTTRRRRSRERKYRRSSDWVGRLGIEPRTGGL
jgi:hypothetical protein